MARKKKKYRPVYRQGRPLTQTKLGDKADEKQMVRTSNES